MTFSNPLFLTSPADTGCIGQRFELKAQTDTDIPALTNIDWYVKPALFIAPAANLGESLANPGANVFALSTTAATATGVEIEAAWSGTPDAKIGRCWLRFDSVGGFIRVTIVLRLLFQHDFGKYAQGYLYNNAAKLLKNEFANPQILNNQTPSVYNQTRAMRFALWANENATNAWSLVKINSAADISLRFFARGLNNAPMERLTAWSAQLLRNGQLVNNLSAAENTVFRFRFTTNASYTLNEGSLYLIRADQNVNSIDYQTNYGLRYTAVPVSPTAPLPAVPLPDYNLDDPATAVFVAPATSITAVSGFNYEFTVGLNGNALDLNGRYRLIFVLPTDDSGDKMAYSFVTDDYAVCGQTALDDLIAPQIDGYLHDYFNTYGNRLVCAPKERLRSQLLLDPAAYNAARSVPFMQALKNVTVTFYALEDPNLQHVLLQFNLTKNLSGVWQMPPNASIDPATGEINAVWRNRWEDNLPNLFTRQLPGGGVLSPLSNMDWSGKTVYIEYRWKLEQPFGFEYLTFVQILDVKAFDEAMSVEYQLNGAAVTQFCANAGNLNVCVHKTGLPDGVRFLTTLEGEPFSEAGLVENDAESSGGALVQLTNEAVVAQDAVFDDETACAELNADALNEDRQYRFCAVVKGEPIEGCGSATPVGGDSEGYESNRNVGLNTGEIVVAYQTYGFTNAEANAYVCAGTDGVYLNWDGNAAQSDHNAATCTGFAAPFTSAPWHYNDGVMAVNKTSALPSSAFIQVKANDTDSLTQWWLKMFCPGVFNQPNRRYLADLSQTRFQSGYDILLHEEAFIFQWNGNVQAVLTLDIPPYSLNEHAVLYQFSVYYNGSLATRTASGSNVFVDGLHTLSLVTHLPGVDYFVVVVTLLPFDAGASTLPSDFPRWRMDVRCAEESEQIGCPNEYAYPLPMVLDDNNTETQCFLLPLKNECRSELSRCDELYNNTRCGNDSLYFQPVWTQTGGECDSLPEPDLLYFQFHLPDLFNNWDGEPTHGWHFSDAPYLIEIGLTDGCCKPIEGDLSAAVMSAWVGEHRDTRMQTIVIDPANLPDCFGFLIKLNSPTEETDPCGLFYTEPYRKVRCENTLLLEGVYLSGFDCANQFYQVPAHLLTTIAPAVAYRNSYRIPGELRLVKLNFDKEDVNGSFVGVSVEENYVLRTPGLPEYVIDKLIPILSAPRLFVDGEEYRFSGELEINNDAGQMWFLSLKLTRLRCEKNYKCVG